MTKFLDTTVTKFLDQTLNDITVTKFLDAAHPIREDLHRIEDKIERGKRYHHNLAAADLPNDISVTKFLEQVADDISVTKFLSTSTDPTLLKYLQQAEEDINVATTLATLYLDHLAED